MIETLQLETPAETTIDDAPKLLVEWTPRWENFVTSIRPAFARSESRLAGESPFGLIPLRIMLPSYVLEALAIFAAILIPITMSSTTRATNFHAPKISAAPPPAKLDAPVATKLTTAPRP